MFDEPQLAVAVLAALALAVVLIVFAVSIRFVNNIMRRRRYLQATLRSRPDGPPIDNSVRDKKEGEDR